MSIIKDLKKRKSEFFYHVIIIIAIFSCYLVAINAPFIFDDDLLIREIGSKNFLQIVHPDSGFRPLYKLTFLGNYWLNGRNPFGYHLVNLIIHFINAILIFHIIRLTLILPQLKNYFSTSAETLSCVCALLWAVHPLQTQAVTYLSQRCEIMMALFSFLTLFLVIKSRLSTRHSTLWQIGALLALFLGLVSKEAIISTPLAIILYDRLFLSTSMNEMVKRGRILYSGFVVAAILPLMYLASKGNFTEEMKNYTGYLFHRHGIDSWQYLLTQVQVILHYIKLVFWPNPLCFDYQWSLVENTATVLLPLCVLLALVGGLIFLTVKNRYLAFPILFFIINLLPRSSIIVSTNAAVEYRMYLPLIGLICFVVIGTFLLVKKWQRISWPIRRNAMVLSAVLCVTSLMVLTCLRNIDYNDPYILWKKNLAITPHNTRALNYYGIELSKRKEFDKAQKVFTELLQVQPNNIMTLNNLANTYAELGRYNEAIIFYERSLEVDKRRKQKEIIKYFNYITYANLAKIYQKVNNIPKAIYNYQQALSLEPNKQDIQFKLGELYMQTGQGGKAEKCFSDISLKDKKFPYAYLNLGLLAAQQQNFNQAESYFRKAIKYKTDYQAAYYNLGLLLSEQGKLDEGVVYFKKSHELNPRDIPTLKCLIYSLSKLGKDNKIYQDKLDSLKQ